MLGKVMKKNIKSLIFIEYFFLTKKFGRYPLMEHLPYIIYILNKYFGKNKS